MAWWPFSGPMTWTIVKVVLLTSGLLSFALTRWFGVADTDTKTIIEIIGVIVSTLSGGAIVADRTDYKLIAAAAQVEGVTKIKVDPAPGAASSGAIKAAESDAPGLEVVKRQA